MFKISALEKLVHELSRLPGIGPKTAQRLAYSILREPDLSTELQSALKQVAEDVHQCELCHSYTDVDTLCRLCTDPHRRDDLLCVVEEPSDILRVESSGAFRGRYHVLHGAISPLDRIGPQDLRIPQLLERVEAGLRGSTAKINEIILALDPDLEGDTTTLYLGRALQAKDLRVTRIASGVPIGSDIDFVDDRTLSRALENRVEL